MRINRRKKPWPMFLPEHGAVRRSGAWLRDLTGGRTLFAQQHPRIVTEQPGEFAFFVEVTFAGADGRPHVAKVSHGEAEELAAELVEAVAASRKAKKESNERMSEKENRA
ncbi:hypothetical protein AB0A05_26810 [Streptomyces sp. NPDC046374]|uniref:hypothetical protein n=1 Tax=Streptomyces sp. NPDC046374 TaxID=3154917 RepID=UPI003409379E